MPSEKSINIDEKFDLLLAELLIKNVKCNNYPRKHETSLIHNDYKYDKNKGKVIE